MNSMVEIILIRHAEVEAKFKPICYGASDVPLSESGVASSLQLAEEICKRVNPLRVFHSGLSRTRVLAEAIAERATRGSNCCEDVRLRERNYGVWQGQSWDDAYASDPDNFHHLIEKPDTYRPPGGETTTEMQQRITAWYRETIDANAASINRPIIAISHSGPITALIGELLNLPAVQWHPHLPKYLDAVAICDDKIVASPW